MSFYQVTDRGLTRQDPKTFSELRIYERGDIQRLLRDDISALGDDLLVLAEEFSHWHDAHRRIDLLAIDRQGRLVVIELKRTDDGGHMELQALRYAAMVSSMDYAEVLSTFETHRAKHPSSQGVQARDELEMWLDASGEEEEPVISTEVRIVLVSANFGREITTAVLWLNKFEGMDIRCVRLVPYELDSRVYVDIQQVIPLPEAADYQVRVRRKEAELERAHASGRDFTRYQIVVDGTPLPDENKRTAVRIMVEQLVRKGVSPAAIKTTMPGSKFRVLEGTFSSPAETESVFVTAFPGIDLRAWFIDHPIADPSDRKTYVLSKGWAAGTERWLEHLASTFPEAGISYQRASKDTVSPASFER